MNMQTKFFQSFLIIFCFSILSFSQTSVKSDNTLSNDVMSVKIKGMHCAGGCAMAVQKALNNTDGIVAANVDFGSSMAMIEYDSTINQDEIMTMLKKHRGGAYEITLLSATNQSKSCTKGKQCCKVNGKINANCDQKSSGCCSSSRKECASKKSKKNK